MDSRPQKYGFVKVSILVPRPKNGPHVVQRFFEDLGWDFTDDLLQIAWLGDQWKREAKSLDSSVVEVFQKMLQLLILKNGHISGFGKILKIK